MMRRVTLVMAGALLATLAMASPVLGGQPAPTRGVMEPATDACPWPDEYNAYVGALKCLPNAIPWTHFEFDGFNESGARIVADPLVASGDSGAAGTVVFWCQFRAGLSYQIRVSGLEPLSTFTVHAMGGGLVFDSGPEAVHAMLGTIHTDANGRGNLNGVLRLDKGLYELDITIFAADDGERLSVPDDDLVGFVVL
ncbi:MAG TPA: hypothetical protein VLA23_05305 [Candidatus Limnocylindrales bacterium]|nr:hypothetical protein [Candidatus Limnocylindrales bacterium]